MPETPATSATGKIKKKIFGTITRAGSVSEIKLIAQAGGEYVSFLTIPDDQGGFAFDNMDEGDYSLILTTTAGFLTPYYRRFTVKDADFNLGSTSAKALRPLGKGSIYGKVSPAEATHSLTFTDAKSSVTVKINQITGNFKATLLPEDTYTISSQTSSAYTSPTLPQ